jgi:hypothetical protein
VTQQISRAWAALTMAAAWMIMGAARAVLVAVSPEPRPRRRDTPERRAEYAAHILSFNHSREEIAEHSAAAICLREQVIADLEDEIQRMTGGEG